MTLGIYFDDAFPFNFFDWTIFLRVIALDLLKNTCHSHFPVNSWYNLMKHFIGFGPFFLCVKFCSYPLFLCEEICRSIAQSTWRSSFTNKPLSTNNHIWRGISIHWICLLNLQFYSIHPQLQKILTIEILRGHKPLDRGRLYWQKYSKTSLIRPPNGPYRQVVA